MSFYHWFSSHPNERSLSGDVSKLQDIAKELRIVDAKERERAKQTDFRRISSVPDIWSQHRLFEMLLLNKAEDPSYLEYEAIAKREWRAMLTLLILAESYDVEIHSETVRFSEAVDNPYLRAAYDARPNAKLWPSMEIYYVKIDDIRYPIAMSSPTVHVIPTKDAWHVLRKAFQDRIPWLTDVQVHAPIVEENGRVVPFLLGESDMDKTPALMPVHALMLYRWLTRYREDMIAQQKRENNRCPLQNLKLVAEFETELEKAFSLKTERMPKIEGFFASAEEREGNRIGEMRVPKNLKVFLDRVFYSVIDQSASLPEILDTNRFAGGIAKECIISKPQQGGKTSHYFVPMPVTEMLWQLWNDNKKLEPVYSLVPVFAGDGVTLRKLTASVVVGDIVFAKSYSVAQIEREQWRNLCTAGIWPRQKIEGWKDYFLFCNEVGGYNLKPESEALIEYKQPYRGKEEVEGALHYYKLKGSIDRCRLEKNESLIGFLQVRERAEIPAGDTGNIYRAALDFGTSATTLYGGVDEATPEKLTGMNLWSLPLLNSVDAAGSETARLEKYFFPPLPLPLSQRGKSASPAEATTISYDELIKKPDVAREYPECVPLQTILADAADENGVRQVFVDSWIFFRAFMFPRDEKKWPKKYSNLKWNRSTQADQFRIKAILAEFLMMLALEARVRRCGKLALTASYPLSFEKRIKESYFESLNEMLVTIADRTGVAILPPPIDEKSDAADEQRRASLVGSITESEAVYRYSVKQDSYNQNYFVVDIGGGSTDIFISLVDEKHRRNSYATSLGFGARKALIDKLASKGNLLLKELMEKSSIKDNLVIRDRTIFLNQLAASSGKHSMMEDLFSFRVMQDRTNPAAASSPESFGDAFTITCAESMLDARARKNDPRRYQEELSFLELKKRIAFYLGASVWLSGRIVRSAAQTDMSVSLLFAGNGSKMIRWLSPDIERIRHFITLLFQKASGANITTEQMSCRFSAKPKEEVAFGALADFPAGFAAAQKGTVKRIQFNAAEEQAEETPAFRKMEYVSENIETDADEFANFMREYRQSAIWSFEWDFFENEYSPMILKNGGIRTAIGQTLPDNGFFLNALDVVAAQYLGSDQQTLTI